MSKHTPGVWKVSHSTGQTYVEVHTNRIVDHSAMTRQRVLSDIIAEVLPISDDQTRIANAKLIAAAPELLDMCKLILVFLEALEKEGGVKVSKGDRIVTDLIKKVVNKAEGE